MIKTLEVFVSFEELRYKFSIKRISYFKCDFSVYNVLLELFLFYLHTHSILYLIS